MSLLQLVCFCLPVCRVMVPFLLSINLRLSLQGLLTLKDTHSPWDGPMLPARNVDVMLYFIILKK